MDCIFCKIIKGEIPSYKVYEDNDYLAFLDIEPRNPGHVQVIPKEHIRWVWDSPNIGEYFKVVQKIANAIKQALDTNYVVSAVFGEDVPHAHVWLVPRFSNDGHGGALVLKNIKKIETEEMHRIADKIKASL